LRSRRERRLGRSVERRIGDRGIAALIGKEIGMPDLTWRHVSAEVSRKKLLE
jgi:hypothetical protein